MIGSPKGWQSPQTAAGRPAWFWQGVALAVAAYWRILGLTGRPADPYGVYASDVALQPSDALRPLFKAAAPRLALRPEDCRDIPSLEGWQSAARNKLSELLRVDLHRPPEVAAVMQTPPRPVGIDVAGNPLYLRRMFLPLSTGRQVPVAIVAAESRERRPVLLWQAGSGAGMHLAWGEVRQPADYQRLSVGADIARQGAARGWVVVCVEQFGFGERRERRFTPSWRANNTASVFAQAVLLGRSLVGERVSDVMAAIDWLRGGMPGMDRAPSIDPRRLLLAGHSSGGMTALFTAALDTRVAAGLVSGSLGRILDTVACRRADGGEGVVPGILDWFETEDIVALIAPRPMATVSGRRDHIYPSALGEEVMATAEAAWAVHRAQTNLINLAGDGGHRIYPEAMWRAVESLTPDWHSKVGTEWS